MTAVGVDPTLLLEVARHMSIFNRWLMTEPWILRFHGTLHFSMSFQYISVLPIDISLRRRLEPVPEARSVGRGPGRTSS